VVDRFVVLESTRTHNRGLRKPLMWDRVKLQPRFAKFAPKVGPWPRLGWGAGPCEVDQGVCVCVVTGGSPGPGRCGFPAGGGLEVWPRGVAGGEALARE
jgi:hypothetical protein